MIQIDGWTIDMKDCNEPRLIRGFTKMSIVSFERRWETATDSYDGLNQIIIRYYDRRDYIPGEELPDRTLHAVLPRGSEKWIMVCNK